MSDAIDNSIRKHMRGSLVSVGPSKAQRDLVVSLFCDAIKCEFVSNGLWSAKLGCIVFMLDVVL